MKKLYTFIFVLLLFAPAALGQTASSQADQRSAAPKRGPVFRANKGQISAAQKMLKSKGLLSGDATGKLDPATREALKGFQKDNGLRQTGTLNRATLEKMGIALTEQQKAIPVSANSFASSKTGASGTTRRAVFRATKEQIAEAQRLMKRGGMYSGDETGKLDDTTREGLKKFQEAKGLKATGTLNQLTLEKMGIALTDRQKGADDSR